MRSKVIEKNDKIWDVLRNFVYEIWGKCFSSKVYNKKDRKKICGLKFMSVESYYFALIFTLSISQVFAAVVVDTYL